MWEVASGHRDGTAFHFTGLGTLDQSLRDWDDLVPLRDREGTPQQDGQERVSRSGKKKVKKIK